MGGTASPVARAALAGLGANSVVAFGPGDDVPLLAGKTLVDGKPALLAHSRSIRYPSERIVFSVSIAVRRSYAFSDSESSS